MEDCIGRTNEQAVRLWRGRRGQRVWATGADNRYVRREELVLQDLDIKQAHLYLCPRPSRTTNSFKLFRKNWIHFC
jgi:hypothetical protein